MKQKNIPYVGAAFEILNRVAFMYSLISQILMTRVYFYNEGDSLLREGFKNYWLFLGFLLLICWILSWLAWAFLIPNQSRWNQEQAIIEGRSPTYELLKKVSSDINEIKKEIKKP